MKVKKIIILLLVIIAVLSSIHLNAIIINIGTLERPLPDGTTQYIHLFGDYHDSVCGGYGQQITQQIEDSVEMITRLGIDNVAVLVEATHVYEGNDPFLKQQIACPYSDGNGELLFELYNELTWYHMQPTNIEVDCRYYYLQYESGQIPVTNKKVVAQFKNSIKTELNKIRNYNHGTYLNKYYRKVAADYTKVLPDLHKNPRLFSHATNPIKKCYTAALSALVEINVLNEIYQCNKRHIFVYCGNSHVKNIVPKLIKGMNCRYLYFGGQQLKEKVLPKDVRYKRGELGNAHKQRTREVYLRSMIKPISIKGYFEEFLNAQQHLFNTFAAHIKAFFGDMWAAIANIWQSIFDSSKGRGYEV